MLSKEDHQKISDAWAQTANLAKSNHGNDGYEAWLNAAKKSIYHANYDNDNLSVQSQEYLVASLIYNSSREDSKNLADSLSISLPKNIEKPSEHIKDAAISNKFVPEIYSKAAQAKQEQMGQRRNDMIYANQDFAIFDMPDTGFPPLDNLHDMVNTLGNMINSLHDIFNDVLFGENVENNNAINNNFVQRLQNQRNNQADAIRLR